MGITQLTRPVFCISANYRINPQRVSTSILKYVTSVIKKYFKCDVSKQNCYIFCARI